MSSCCVELVLPLAGSPSLVLLKAGPTSHLLQNLGDWSLYFTRASQLSWSVTGGAVGSMCVGGLTLPSMSWVGFGKEPITLPITVVGKSSPRFMRVRELALGLTVCSIWESELWTLTRQGSRV